jgi:hypothetical protein
MRVIENTIADHTARHSAIATGIRMPAPGGES